LRERQTNKFKEREKRRPRKKRRSPKAKTTREQPKTQTTGELTQIAVRESGGNT
jgi:hypothetical protein